MKGLNVTSKKMKAIILEDKLTNLVTIYLDEIGGPIISAPTIEEAKEKFSEALSLGCAVRNLNFYAAAVKASDEQRKDIVKKLDHNDSEIEYLTVQPC